MRARAAGRYVLLASPVGGAGDLRGGAEHLESLGPVIVEPVGVGILFKGKRTFVELRPRAKWVALSFGLNRRAEHPRITRTTRTNTARTYHGVRITGVADVDDVVRAWLTESYFELGP